MAYNKKNYLVNFHSNFSEMRQFFFKLINILFFSKTFSVMIYMKLQNMFLSDYIQNYFLDTKIYHQNNTAKPQLMRALVPKEHCKKDASDIRST